MKLADMKLMLKVAGWRLRSHGTIREGSRNARSWYVVDDKGDLRSRYYDTPYPAVKWGFILLTGNEEMRQEMRTIEIEVQRLKRIEYLDKWGVK